MSFAAIEPKILIMIINYTSYNKQNFWSSELRESEFSVLLLFFFPPP